MEHQHHSHEHEDAGRIDGSEVLEDRQPVFLGRTLDQKFFIYLSNDSNGVFVMYKLGKEETPEGEKIVAKRYEVNSSHRLEDGSMRYSSNQGALTTGVLKKWQEPHPERAGQYVEHPLIDYPIEDFTFTEKASGQLIIHHKEN